MMRLMSWQCLYKLKSKVRKKDKNNRFESKSRARAIIHFNTWGQTFCFTSWLSTLSAALDEKSLMAGRDLALSAFQSGWRPPSFEFPITRNSTPLRSSCYLSWKRQHRKKCFPLCVKLCDTRGRFVRGREKLCRGIEKSRLLRLLMWFKLFSLRIWQLIWHPGICPLACAELKNLWIFVDLEKSS